MPVGEIEIEFNDGGGTAVGEIEIEFNDDGSVVSELITMMFKQQYVKLKLN